MSTTDDDDVDEVVGPPPAITPVTDRYVQTLLDGCSATMNTDQNLGPGVACRGLSAVPHAWPSSPTARCPRPPPIGGAFPPPQKGPISGHAKRRASIPS
jgi:hypothetical protein